MQEVLHYYACLSNPQYVFLGSGSGQTSRSRVITTTHFPHWNALVQLRHQSDVCAKSVKVLSTMQQLIGSSRQLTVVTAVTQTTWLADSDSFAGPSSSSWSKLAKTRDGDVKEVTTKELRLTIKMVNKVPLSLCQKSVKKLIILRFLKRSSSSLREIGEDGQSLHWWTAWKTVNLHLNTF